MKANRMFVVTFASVLISGICGAAPIDLAKSGQTSWKIAIQPGATAPDRTAASELSTYLQRSTGARFDVVESNAPPKHVIVVGQGPLAKELFPDIDLTKAGDEEIVIAAANDNLLIAGGRPRGTLYAASHFLQKYCGVRWWAPWAESVPAHPNLNIDLSIERYKSPFESRNPFWFPAFNKTWARRNFSNSQNAGLQPDDGEAIIYQGFVHTFHPLVPPEKHFKDHPEWYSLIKGKRTAENAQLCLSNPELLAFVIERVREEIRANPQARIVSVSQNDCFNPCECPNCKAIDDAEGSPSGSLLKFVNQVAEKIEPEFPQVAVDTLAYQYTRKAPKTIKPRANVIVRLCSIECNFAEPLDHPSNAAFLQDLKDWSRVSNRLYVWDYTTDFSHYVQPHPNWHVLGPNLRLFQQYHVVGMFEQGAYQSFGSEMSELRSWVLAQLLWNPQQDDAALIREFALNYYGPAAGPLVLQYMELMRNAARGFNLTCFSGQDTPFFNFKTLSQSESIWQKAEQAAKDSPDLQWRVRMGHMPLLYVWISRWDELKKQSAQENGKWPLADSRKAVADQWLEICHSKGPEGWTPVSHLNESGLTPDAFYQQVTK